ncbi:hypothetical protein D3C78_643310 [compost metagenome]
MRGAAPPVILGKLALAGGATNEVVAQRAFQGRMTQKHRQVAPVLDHLEAAEFGVVLFTLHLRRACVDIGTFADHPGEEVFVSQLGVGVGNGLARNTQLFGQQAAGGQLCPGGQATGLDSAAQLVVQLAGQVLATVDDNM